MLRFQENIRGEEVFNRNPEMFAHGKAFSAMIFAGKGELLFKCVDGVWYERILTVDRCFGVMKSRPRKLNIAAH